ncbi:MarR family winged helix-turn-helix transcriptional regulator [Roseovarius aestuariivivens]|uniref:MarR family winged helix-turn-helix transcriptional regulator n=1 Tax=Roseovarius aestuariivivens TaxID=1888910 RepID=UPI001081AD95|nr:MarR family transcriptional regulator [Roseovarius aestuariivivens]
MDRTRESLVALRRILRATEMSGQELARSSGLTSVQARVLNIISEDGNHVPKEIALRLNVSQATVTALLQKLEAKGLIARCQSEQDRRQYNLWLTEAGRAALKQTPDALQQVYVTRFEQLPKWEQSMIVAALERVAYLMDAEKIHAAPVLEHGDLARGA